jgi:uncharacterized protein
MRYRVSMPRRKAILVLSLLVPAPSLGALCAMVWFPDMLKGVLLFGLSKVWLLALPLAWHWLVEREPLSLSPIRRGGIAVGVLSGLAISAIIVIAYTTMADTIIDRRFLTDQLSEIGLGARGTYICGAAYWILVNSVLEEYVWRWFCVRQCERLVRPSTAIILSALCFTLHHIVAMQVYFGMAAVLVCSAGVFLGGAIWSAMYVRYRSIWPGYVSHAIVDLCIFAIGWSLLF